MANRSPTKNAQLKQAVSLMELNESELRGIQNTGYNEIYHRRETVPYDVKDGSFMVDNPEFIKKHDVEYMDEIESSPWYYGIISRNKAEDILESCDIVGAFLVRAGIKEGEFYISVKAPEGGAKVIHLEVDRYQDEFVTVWGSDADPVEFSTFIELIEYLQSTPAYYNGFDSDIMLKDFVPKRNY